MQVMQEGPRSSDARAEGIDSDQCFIQQLQQCFRYVRNNVEVRHVSPDLILRTGDLAVANTVPPSSIWIRSVLSAIKRIFRFVMQLQTWTVLSMPTKKDQ